MALQCPINIVVYADVWQELDGCVQQPSQFKLKFSRTFYPESYPINPGFQHSFENGPCTMFYLRVGSVLHVYNVIILQAQHLNSGHFSG